MFGNQIRFTGMSSGMDTQTIVQQLMRAESMRMDRMTRRRQLAMWRQEQFRDIATNLRTFRDEHLSQVGRTNNIMRAATFRAWETSVTMSGIADPNSALHRGITVTTNPDAQAGTFDFRVNTLVQNAAIHGHTAANRAAPPSATTNVGGGTN
ncbi:MAG: hypothetical protein FWC07_09255, partial [Defluviitaleaceae bacterium]|nr:hypothetical protein [Defluviitaleaceae bacterium]